MKKSLGAKVFPLPAPVWLVGTYDANDKANIMTAAWAGICCSRPACVYVSLRKATYSYDNIVARKAYTVNIPSRQFVRETDYAGIVSGRDVDKFSASGLTAAHGEYVDAPFIEEFPVVIECSLLHTIEIGLHTQFIGEIEDVRIEESMLNEKETPDVDKLGLFVYTGDYYQVGSLLGKAYTVGKAFTSSDEDS